MPVISIRLSVKLLHDTETWAKKLGIPRAEYIRQAIIMMNTKMSDLELRKQMERASRMTRDNSMRINREFSEIEFDNFE